MAKFYVYIYPEHRDLLDALLTSAKTKSVAAGTKTGPFKEMRDVYVFAASIAMALNRVVDADKLPTSKKNVVPIDDRVFLGADGAEQLAYAVALVDTPNGGPTDRSIAGQLDLLAEENLGERLALLDRYAYAGFEWLKRSHQDESGVRDLVLTALDQIECVPREVDDDTTVRDPLLDFMV